MLKNSIVLLSGGIDSTACIHYYLTQGFNTNAVFIDYGQITFEKELESAKKIAAHYKINLDIIILRNSTKFSQGEIKGRNAFLIFSVLLNYPNFQGILSLGIHSGTPYYDCSKNFINDITEILNGYTNGEIILDTPFLTWDKKMIHEYCKTNKIPIHLTYSCENNSNGPCGVCKSCLDRRALDGQ